jgi:hypothetical protein
MVTFFFRTKFLILAWDQPKAVRSIISHLLLAHILEQKCFPKTVDGYLSMKEGSLFCFVVMRSTKSGCFRSCSWCLWKALDEEGCMGMVP